MPLAVRVVDQASEIVNTPAGNIAATSVQGALNELDSEKATTGHTTPVMVASGGSHAAGHVPDPPSGSGTTKFLREDASWAVPSTPLTFKQTILQVGGNIVRTGTTFAAIDSTNLAFLTLTGLAVGDVVELKLTGSVLVSASNNGFLDFEVDRPTSANHRVYESSAAGGWRESGGPNAVDFIARYVVGEAGDHGFRPVWRSDAGSFTFYNGAASPDAVAIVFGVQKLGAVTA